jgi:HPt (histidine-containing phosphotransfer) domain-containing protein
MTCTTHPSDRDQAIVEVDAELADLVPTYLGRRRDDLQRARDLLSRQRFAELARLAHRIHGSAASYGFNQLGDLAAQLRYAADAGDAETAAGVLARYDAHLRGLRIRYI